VEWAEIRPARSVVLCVTADRGLRQPGHVSPQPNMKKITSSLLVAVAALVCASPLALSAADQKKAQKAPPLPGAGTGGNTPHVTTSGVIGPNRNEGGMVTITFGRPHAVHPRKGGEPRKIWGGLVAWDKADRLGADEATTLINQHPIEVAGTVLPSGAYTLYIIPSEKGTSKLAFSKNIGKWGVPVDETKDVLRADLKKETLSESVDQLTISVEASPAGSMNGLIKIKWERTQYSLPFTLKK
jgi:hypothetical protein